VSTFGNRRFAFRGNSKATRHDFESSYSVALKGEGHLLPCSDFDSYLLTDSVTSRGVAPSHISVMAVTVI
jgi:hypothetical protein